MSVLDVSEVVVEMIRSRRKRRRWVRKFCWYFYFRISGPTLHVAINCYLQAYRIFDSFSWIKLIRNNAICNTLLQHVQRSREINSRKHFLSALRNAILSNVPFSKIYYFLASVDDYFWYKQVHSNLDNATMQNWMHVGCCWMHWPN